MVCLKRFTHPGLMVSKIRSPDALPQLTELLLPFASGVNAELSSFHCIWHHPPVHPKEYLKRKMSKILNEFFDLNKNVKLKIRTIKIIHLKFLYFGKILLSLPGRHRTFPFIIGFLGHLHFLRHGERLLKSGINSQSPIMYNY